jgi:tetratricopeptide (TPR) repeat protein
MSEELANTQPQEPFEADKTQPLKPVKKTGRWRSVVLSILGVLALLALGSMGGYWSGIGVRQSTEQGIRTKQLTEQFQYALVDEQFGRYDSARERLEFIIGKDPNFPGAQNELANVLVKSTIPTATLTPTITPTPDLRGNEAMLASAKQLVAAGDWANALAQLDQLRKTDATYQAAQVDGMYYFTLRNYGVSLIHEGNLEGGIYQLTLAERFAPLDGTANGLREGARAYVQAGSYFGVDWARSVEYLSQVATGWPSLSDGTMTASQRYYQALMRYGDQLWLAGDACGAYTQYQAATALGSLDETAAKYANQAFKTCYPPTAVPPTAEPTESAVPSSTEPPPTAPPTP